MDFKTFHTLTEELAMKRTRKVRKNLEKKKKIKYGTFGFDIEFDYSENITDDQMEEWKRFIKRDHRFGLSDRFYQFLEKQDDNPNYYDIDEWEEHNEAPDTPDTEQYPEPTLNQFEIHADYIEAHEQWLEVENEWSDYMDEYNLWNDQRDEMITAIKEWDEKQDDYLDEFATENLSEIYDYLDIQTNSYKLDEYKDILEDLGEDVVFESDVATPDFNTQWVLSLDGGEGHPPEIASRILTTKDIPLVRELLEKLEDEKTSPNTSAHIHIGMPKDFDLFSVFALFNLVDEKTIENRLPDREFDAWAAVAYTTLSQINVLGKALIQNRMKVYKHSSEKHGERYILDKDLKRFHDEVRYIRYTRDGKIEQDEWSEIADDEGKKFTILNEYESKRHDGSVEYIEYQIEWNLGEKPGFEIEELPVKHINDKTIEITEDMLKFFYKSVVKKMSGVNMTYFPKRKTIEFRYLSSDILGNIDEFLSFINYFLFLPHIAARAKRINLNQSAILKGPNGRYRIIVNK